MTGNEGPTIWVNNVESWLGGLRLKGANLIKVKVYKVAY